MKTTFLDWHRLAGGRSTLLPGLLCFCFLTRASEVAAQFPSGPAPEQFSLQAALDDHPGQAIQLPPSELVLHEPVRIRHNGSSVRGPGRLVQATRETPFFELQGVRDVALSDMSLIRPLDGQNPTAPAIVVQQCESVTLAGLTIHNSLSPASVIRFEQSRHVTIARCEIRNYMALSVDDRTDSPHYGYAFNCIDGTGICISDCRDVLLQGNRVIDEQVKPTPEFKQQHQLGTFVKRAASKGSLISQATWDSGYVNNWHQGSAIIVTGPETTRYVRVMGNHIENAAQGIDLHADFVTVSGNMVINSFMGMKAMHGSRHILIANNQFIKNDLWSIGLMPGTASHAARSKSPDQAPQTANVDGGSIIANNIISQFGHGDSHWIWDSQQSTCAPIVLDHGQEPDDPPLCDVVITGNVVDGCARDSEDEAGATTATPRYRFSVFINNTGAAPQGIRFFGNLFHPGTEGISNVTIAPNAGD